MKEFNFDPLHRLPALSLPNKSPSLGRSTGLPKKVEMLPHSLLCIYVSRSIVRLKEHIFKKSFPEMRSGCNNVLFRNITGQDGTMSSQCLFLELFLLSLGKGVGRNAT